MRNPSKLPAQMKEEQKEMKTSLIQIARGKRCPTKLEEDFDFLFVDLDFKENKHPTPLESSIIICTQ